MVKQVINGLIRVRVLEMNYTCAFTFECKSFTQGFGKWRIRNDEEFNFWVDVIKGITGKDPETAMEEKTPANTIIDSSEIYGIGNSNGTYWVVDKGDHAEVLNDKESIKKYFNENGIKFPAKPDKDNKDDAEIEI